MITEEQKTETKKSNKDYVSTVGRRRSAVARVRIYSKVPDSLKFGELLVKKGDLAVNGKNISEYFSGTVSKAAYEHPLKLSNSLNKCPLS